MSDRNQFGIRRTSARQAAVITPGNILKRPEAQKTAASATLHDTLAHAQDTQAPVSVRGESKRPVSFSHHSTVQNNKPQATTKSTSFFAGQPSASVSAKPSVKVKKPKNRNGLLKRIGFGFFNFIDKHIRGILIALGGLAIFGYFHEVGAQNDEKRARLDNEPLATLTPTSEYEAAVQAARNLVPSPSKQMKNGFNTAFKNWKGSISEITGGADIDTLSTKDGTRPDKSYIVSGAMAGKTRAYLGDTLVKGGGNLYKGTYHEKPANPDQARVLEVVDLNELTKRVSDLPKEAYRTSPTEARLDTSKQTKAAREAARKAAAKQMAQQKLTQRGK